MGFFSWSDPPSRTAFSIAKAGYPYIAASAFATAIFALIDFDRLALLGLLTTFFICYFFRDPDRVVPNAKGAIVSPADGKIIVAQTAEKGPFFEDRCVKISIFMSVFNVHVNRIPFGGKIKKVRYFPGKFFAANLDKASKANEHNAVYLETGEGRQVCFVQIAGLIARRIICNVQAGDKVERGQRFGMICFGSRLDVYLPADTRLEIAVGNSVKAGTSILGYLT